MRQVKFLATEFSRRGTDQLLKLIETFKCKTYCYLSVIIGTKFMVAYVSELSINIKQKIIGN